MTIAAPLSRGIKGLPALLDETIPYNWESQAKAEDGLDWWSEMATKAAWDIERLSWAPPASRVNSYAEAGDGSAVPFYVVVNTEVKREGDFATPDEFVITNDFSEEAQKELGRRVVEAFVRLCQEKKDARNIVWRGRPEWQRVMAPDGLRIRLRARLAWVD